MELKAITEAGSRFVALAEEHAEDFASRADQHDREGTFPFENFEAMKQSGFIAGTVPASFGGMGVASAHDMALAIGRLGRGCASTAIAVNMHLAVGWTMRRMHEAGAPTAPAIEGLFKGIAAGGVVCAVFGTEAGTDIDYPRTTATANEDGYVIEGRKIFGTLSPVANVIFSPLRVLRDGDTPRAGMGMLTRDMPGMHIMDNWDALGMRASGSNDVVYENVQASPANVIGGTDEIGTVRVEGLEQAIAGNVGLICAFMGIAEAARDLAVQMARTRRKGERNRLLAERASVQHMVGEMDIDLSMVRSACERAGRVVDDFTDRHGWGAASMDEALEMQHEFQCAKWVANRKAIDVVDKALTISGGAGYMNKSPLSRMYRDVRAGPFMQPYAPHEAPEFIGRIALGQDPEPDR